VETLIYSFVAHLSILFSRLYLSFWFFAGSTFLLFGKPRSGTSWQPLRVPYSALYADRLCQ
jgi:hypothetical protein